MNTITQMLVLWTHLLRASISSPFSNVSFIPFTFGIPIKIKVITQWAYTRKQVKMVHFLTHVLTIKSSTTIKRATSYNYNLK